MQALFFMQIQNFKSDFRFFDFLLFLGIKSETNHYEFKWRHFNRLWIDLEIQFQSRSMSDPTFSDIDFKNKMAQGLDYP